MNHFKKVLAVLFGLFVVLFGPTLFFMADDNDTAAAVCATLTVGTLFAFTHVAAFAGGALYTRGAMQMGADVALKAQASNDRWDERKTVAFGRLMTEGARIGKMAAGRPGEDAPALPLPSQGMDWLPAPSAFDVVDADAEEDWSL